ncbi:hypothetical protein FACS189499_08510 [Clostridia bacterium]|nr:hypothetical protein FACS189499_08510 [Clostridia bacterium]
MKNSRKLIAAIITVVLILNLSVFTAPIQAAETNSVITSQSQSGEAFNASVKSATDTSVTVSWFDPPTGAAICDVFLNGNPTATDLNKSEFSIGELAPATEYIIKVRAKSAPGSIYRRQNQSS